MIESKERSQFSFCFQVEFVGGPMAWNTRLFSATSGKKFLLHLLVTFHLIALVIFFAKSRLTAS